eukprot:TRINITY_DN65383_c0_g1_i1.p1 TRINITY_DN65383_c0_g1~~TRINITY_DN65383_c0_g1_i1.p1  ORF type:complete len:403 (-),score=78.25 TRINITY_DN65383_c0_g1_i1:97-1158(-)
MRLGSGASPGEYAQPRNESEEGHGGYDDPNDGLACLESPLVLGGLLCCLVAAVGFATMSIGAVPPLHYGISYNAFTKVANTDAIYQPGRYFIGPFNNFLLFPSAVQTIEFSDEPRLAVLGVRYEPLHTRTKEGLGLHLKVSLQYRLLPETLGKLYSEFNLNYEQVFISSIRDMLIKSASEFEASQLWKEREEFAFGMQKLVSKELAETYAECWGVQLMVIELPDEFEQSIVQTQVQQQYMLTRQQEQQSAQIRAHTDVIRAEYDRQVKVIMAAGSANRTITEKEAQAKAQQNVIDVESQVLQSIRTSLNIDAEGLVAYQKYNAIDDMEEASLYYGFAGSVLAAGAGAATPSDV